MNAAPRQTTGDLPAKRDPRDNLRVGGGRPKGVPNKSTTLLKDAILQAATLAGGGKGLVGYLERQANEEPKAFLPLLGKVLPMQITGEDGGPLTVVIAKPDA